jgi:hypothetical protein
MRFPDHRLHLQWRIPLDFAAAHCEEYVNHMASIKRYDDEARPSDAGGFYNAFQPASPKTTLRPDFFTCDSRNRSNSIAM